MKVEVEVTETELVGERGQPIDGVVVTCERCNESVEVFGTSDRSIRRGCVMLKEQCDEDNFYVHEEG